MLKKIITILLIFIFMTGCKQETTDQEEKSEYLAYKSDLVDREEFSENDDLPCDITISIDRVNDESVSYTTIISNAKENMNDIKMMIVHNYFTEEVFPTIGVFDKGRSLTVSDTSNITLVGYIDTTKDIKKLNLELKIWIEYTTEDGEVKDIYYKTTK